MSAPLLTAALDAVDSPLLVLDGRVEVQFANAAARRYFEIRGRFAPARAGEVLRCVHAGESPAGCGGSSACRSCLIRRSVLEALKTLVPVRERIELRRLGAGEGESRRFLLTAAPFEQEGTRLVLLTLQDVDELLMLRGLLPVCGECGRRRDDPALWQGVERYLDLHRRPDPTLGRCPACGTGPAESAPDLAPRTSSG